MVVFGYVVLSRVCNAELLMMDRTVLKRLGAWSSDCIRYWCIISESLVALCRSRKWYIRRGAQSNSRRFQVTKAATCDFSGCEEALRHAIKAMRFLPQSNDINDTIGVQRNVGKVYEYNLKQLSIVYLAAYHRLPCLGI